MSSIRHDVVAVHGEFGNMLAVPSGRLLDLQNISSSKLSLLY